MATLARTRTAHDDVSDTARDLRFGIPTPFPSNALVREEGELLDPLANKELRLDDDLHPHPHPLQPQLEQYDDETTLRERDALESVHRPAVSVIQHAFKRIDLSRTGRPTALHRTSSGYLRGDFERYAIRECTMDSDSSGSSTFYASVVPACA